MWKLVKAELNYLKPWILGVSGFFILISLIVAARTNEANVSVMVWEFPGVGVFAGVASIGFIFATLYLEIKENRLRQQAVLPVPIREVGEARVVVPVMVWLIFAGLIALTIIIQIVRFAVLIPDFPAKASVFLFVNTDWKSFCLYAITIWISIVYGLRLFSEWHGRLLLGAVLCVFMLQVVMSNFFWRFYATVWTDRVFYWFEPPMNYVTYLLLLILFVLVIHVSFLRRRSFMA